MLWYAVGSHEVFQRSPKVKDDAGGKCMMEKYTYLLVNLASVIVPFLFSFHPKLEFHKQWKFYLPAMLSTALVFILWDSLYTHLGVWHFNARYLMGIYFLGLPLEEILFFICIPYASIFSYHCFKLLVKKDYFQTFHSWISTSLIVLLILVGIFYFPRLYTAVTFLLTALFIYLIRNQPWLSRFYFSHIILLIPFFIVNGILTGTGLDEPVVLYNSHEMINLRILTIPIEDSVYGFLLLGLNACLFEMMMAWKYKTNAVSSV
jgi:lycopene cyclase domain-containing protein